MLQGGWAKGWPETHYLALRGILKFEAVKSRSFEVPFGAIFENFWHEFKKYHLKLIRKNFNNLCFSVFGETLKKLSLDQNIDLLTGL